MKGELQDIQIEERNKKKKKTKMKMKIKGEVSALTLEYATIVHKVENLVSLTKAAPLRKLTQIQTKRTSIYHQWVRIHILRPKTVHLMRLLRKANFKNNKKKKT
jgi:hypothetical protein